MTGSARRIVVEFLGKDSSLGSTASSVERKTSRLGGLLGKVGKAAAVGLGAGLAVGTVAAVKFGKAAIEDAAGAKLLEGQLKRSAGATKAQTAAVEDWITKQGISKGVADDELRPALASLVTATKDVDKAQRLAGLAMDVSAAKGKSLEAVSEALMKAQNGNVGALGRLGVATKNAKGETLTFDQVVKNMGDTFGGAASQKANTLQGKIDRLKLIFSETGEAIGAKLLPIVNRLGTWFLNEGLPAITRFGNWISANVIPVLKQFGSEGSSIFEKVRAKVGPLVDRVMALARIVGSNLKPVWDQAVATFRAKVAPTLQLVADKLREWAPVVGRVIAKVYELASAILGKVLPPVIRFAGFLFATAVPAVIKTIEVLARIVGTVFRVGAAFVGGVADVARFVTGVTNKVGEAIRFVQGIPGKVRAAIGNLGSLLWNAGASIIQGLIDGVQSKISALTSKLKSVTDLIPRFKGPMSKDKILLKPAGVAIMEGLIEGIESKKVRLAGVLKKITAAIGAQKEKLTGILDERNQFADQFASFRSSIFGADTSSEYQPPDVTTTDKDGNTTTTTPDVVKIPATVESLLAFQRNQQARAEQLNADVGSLISKGLSKDLVQQLASSGESGMDQIRLLATASQDQINAFNASNAATEAALSAAGQKSADALYLAQVSAQEKQLELMELIRTELAGLNKKADKDEYVVIQIDGDNIVTALRKKKRKSGQKLGLD